MEGAHYVLHERLGVGGMAEVFFATARGAEGFERPVAIKRILRHLSDDYDFVQMFVDEAKIAVQLQHPNIVQVLDLGRVDGEYFIAMEFVHGKDLRAIWDAVRRTGAPMPPKVAIHVALRICEGLHHAHDATGQNGQPLGVVHRDVTPQNVLLSFDGEVKVADFGLAKAAGRATQTKSGIVKGKLAYMAPEAFRGFSLDRRSDVYSVGILLWEMLTGRRLFLGRNDVETVKNARAAVVPPIRSIDPAFPDALDAILARALARDRDVRYPTAEAFHDDLEAFSYAHQQFMTTAALAAWLRSLFDVPPEPSLSLRIADPSTRQIRLTELTAPPPRDVAPLAPPLPEYAPPEDELDITVASAVSSTGAWNARRDAPPLTRAPEALPFDPFADLTDESFAAPSGAHSLEGVVVAPLGAVSISDDLAWDDEDDKTEVSAPAPKPPRA